MLYWLVHQSYWSVQTTVLISADYCTDQYRRLYWSLHCTDQYRLLYWSVQTTVLISTECCTDQYRQLYWSVQSAVLISADNCTDQYRVLYWSVLSTVIWTDVQPTQALPLVQERGGSEERELVCVLVVYAFSGCMLKKYSFNIKKTLEPGYYERNSIRTRSDTRSVRTHLNLRYSEPCCTKVDILNLVWSFYHRKGEQRGGQTLRSSYWLVVRSSEW